tara:strand:+ start:547 stop:720 length:174 start_codon:yes stop_codon:yes gene_type:complete
MIKYRIFTKSLIADNLDEDEMYSTLEQLQDVNPNILYETEEYDPPKPNRLGRDPDLH